MSDEQGRPQDQAPVGNVAEEAAKLLGALQDWARDNATRPGTAGASAASGMAARLSDINAHLATGGDDCVYCPVCQVIHVVRQTSPEVKEQLTTAASALLQAAAGLLEASTPRRSDPGVEKIDLD